MHSIDAAKSLEVYLHNLLVVCFFVLLNLLHFWINLIFRYSNPLNGWVHVPSGPSNWYSSSQGCKLGLAIVRISIKKWLIKLVICVFDKLVKHGVLMLS